jgi:flagellar hook-associated protein 2
MAGTNLISGLSSGFDWSTMVDQLIEIERSRVTVISNKKTTYQNKLSAWQSFNTKLLSLKTAASALKDPDSFNVFKASMASSSALVKADDLLSVSASSSASIGSYSIKVNTLAAAQKMSSKSMESRTGALAYSGDLLINGKAVAIASTDTLNNIRDKINHANSGADRTGVTATIVSYAAADHRLILTSDETGAAGMDLGGGLFDSLEFSQLAAGVDASVTVDGVTISRSSNRIDDVIDGITLDLLKADTETTVTLNITQNVDSIISKINTFVTNYNSVASYIKAQTSYDQTEQKAGGVLFGDGTLSSVRSDITSILVQSVWGVSADFSTMGLVGINVDTNGQLSVNTSTLRANLISNFNDIKRLFTADGTTSAGTLAFISHSRETRPGDYAVNITQAATQSASAASDYTSLSGDETLTISDGSKVAAIDLTGGMTMDEVADAVNAELSTAHAQTLAGSAQLFADTEQNAQITSLTKWSSIYNSSGQSAGLIDDDVISFSGTLRNGTTVSGSYTIGSVSDDSVQGLLSAVETAFGNAVTASISESGRILIADKTTGASDVSLTFDMALAHDLSFGTVETANEGGRTGRQVMNMTASVDAGGHLILKSNSYGSGNSFTIQQANSLVWDTEDDLVVGNGLDVAGTINGEAATGTGQVLRGNAGEANTDGLSIRYTAAATGAVGSVKLTLGVAELYDRALFQITDSIDGYVSFKQQSLQESINNFQTQIRDMEAILAKKREQMLNRFLAMELALQKIQSQSSWLTGQLTAAENGWWGNKK